MEQTRMFHALPMDNPEGAKTEKEPENCLADMLAELMSERGIELAEVQRGTGISWGTLHGWCTGQVGCQMADKNLLKLAQFFNVHLEYLCFGIGNGEPAYGDNYEVI